MLCVAMKSSLELECPAEGGSRFSFAVQMKRASPPPATPPAGEARHVPAASGAAHAGSSEPGASTPASDRAPLLPSGLRVLVADDVKINRILLRNSLKWVLPQPKLTEAATGEAALELLREGNFDLAILDEIYDNGSGNEGKTLRGSDVTRQVRALEAQRLAGAPPPSDGHPTGTRPRMAIIGCTGNAGTPEHASIALGAGQDVIWPKPVPTKDEMRRDICRVLSSKLS